ncbi:hypothetical protein SRHO_G00017430 [Serrasalmus rhombeus]
MADLRRGPGRALVIALTPPLHHVSPVASRSRKKRFISGFQFCAFFLSLLAIFPHNVDLGQRRRDEESRPAAALRGEHRQSEGVSGCGRASAVLYPERSSGPSAHRCLFKHQPLQDAEALLFCLMSRRV